jgi:hypothetical protein
MSGSTTTTSRSLGDCTEWLVDHAPAVEEYIDTTLRRLTAAGIELPYYNDQLPLTPAILPRTCFDRIDIGSRAVFRGMQLIYERCFDSDADRLSDFLLFTEAERALLHVAPGSYDWGGIARPDFVIGPDGPGMLETNISTSLGLVEVGLLADILLGLPPIRELVATSRLTSPNPARKIVAAIARIADPSNGSVMFVDWAEEIQRWQFEGRYLASLLAELGIQAGVCAIEDLKYRDGRVTYAGAPIDVVYRFYTTIVLATSPAARDVHAPLQDAVAHGRVKLFGSYAHKLFTPKLFLALLSDERYACQLPDRLRVSIDRIVPWTRLVEDRTTRCEGRQVDLMSFAAANREQLVLKPNLGFGGKRVMVGSYASQSEWETALSDALLSAEHWLLQKALPIDEAELPFLDERGRVVVGTFKVDYGAFMVDRHCAGIARRNATKTSGPMLTNLSRGGGLGPVFIQK